MVLEESDRERLHEMVTEELRGGRQAFIIYPLVEESERLELKAAEQMASHLEKEVFPDYRVGLIHGRMDGAAKKEAMDEFAAGRIHVLVSTTVVEVGVDIPRATVMVVEHAERFGLAQLHQLRGRVGRRGQEAACLLVVSEDAGAEARERLEVMSRIDDGFQLAEEDLKHRGPGELAGLKQSGAPDFLLANLIRHRRALEFARKEAFEAVRGKGPGKYELTKLLELANIRWSSGVRLLYSG
jgi:ATP-dependent DNA helicase RecG